jgi:UDP-4-amino-4,6-dideoxy-N-acetyl-beta-L-altrosamine N-acetyltransferase
MRPLEEKDKDLLLRWRNSERVRSKMLTDHVIGEDEHKKWFEREMKKETAGNFIFEYDGIPLGYISLDDADWQNRRCEIGIYLGETRMKLPEAGILIYKFALRHAFGVWRLHKVCASVLADNERALALNKFAGLRQEGILRQHLKKENGYSDLVLLAILYDEWAADSDNWLEG